MNYFPDFSPGGIFLRRVLGEDRYNALCAFRVCFGLLFIVPAYLFAVGFICYWPIKELMLEASYRKKYGEGWKTQFEQYHGSLSHAHLQVAVCFASVVALTVVSVIAWRVFFRNKQRRHHNAA